MAYPAPMPAKTAPKSKTNPAKAPGQTKTKGAAPAETAASQGPADAPRGAGQEGAAPEVKVDKERGLAGTRNDNGRLRAGDDNPKLVWEKAFGVPGAVTWGEWERILRTDPAIATTLNLVAAPLRDCEVVIEPAKTVATKPAQGKEFLPISPPVDPKGAPASPKVVKPTTLAAGMPPAPERVDVETDEDLAAGGETDPEVDGEGAPVVGAPMDPAPPTLEQVIAEFVQDNITEWLAPGWASIINTTVVWGLGSGFAMFEKVHGTRADIRVAGGTATFLAKLAHRLPSSIRADGWKERDGDLYEVHQAGARDGKWESDIALPASSLLLCTWDRSGNNYAGYPAFRSVWYLTQIRAALLRILAIGSEREALGVPVVEQDLHAKLNEPQVSALQELVENLAYHEKAGVVLPPGVTMNWVFSEGADKTSVLNTWKALGVAILEVCQAEQTALGTGDTGSRSVGDTKTATKNGFIEGVRGWIESCWNGIGDQVYTGVIKELVDLNFGPQPAYPKLRLITKKGDMPIGEFAPAAKALSDAGAITFTPEDENDLRERLGMKPIDPAVRQAEQDRKKAMAAAIAGGQGGGFGGGPPKPPPGDAPEVAEVKKELADLRALVVRLTERPAKTLAEILEED